MSFDELNEFLNLWNKGIVTSPIFETVCEETKHVMVFRACAFVSFGSMNKQYTKPSTGDGYYQANGTYCSCQYFLY